jgi:hypothetical protein
MNKLKKDLYIAIGFMSVFAMTIVCARQNEHNRDILNRIEAHYLNKVDSLIQNDIEREEMYDRWKERNDIGFTDYLD